MQRPPKTRRQTLGPINVNAVEEKSTRREPSTGQVSSTSKMRPPTGRASMIPRVGRENVPPSPPSSAIGPVNSSSRRSSIDPERRQSHLPHTTPSKTDPRPISDKTFQQNCIKKMLRYLVDHSYDYPITHKSLARPSGKDFYHIVTFMLRLVDPNFQDGSMKIEDEVALAFKALGYPFPLSKTSLVAAGSSHAWPSLLAALTWLAERGTNIQTLDEDPEEEAPFRSLEELEMQTDKAFFRYLSASYTAFLRDDDNATEQLEVGLAERFEKDDEFIEKEIEQMTDKNAVILEQINNLTIDSEDLQTYVEKRDGYITDLAQFHDLIDQMDNHVKMLEQKKSDKKTDLQASYKKLITTNALITDLKALVRSQELNLEAASSLKNAFKGVCESISRANSLNHERQSIANQTIIENKTLWNQLEEAVACYNGQLLKIGTQLLLTECFIEKIATGERAVFAGRLALSDVGIEIQHKLISLKSDVVKSVLLSKNLLQEKMDVFAMCEGKLSETLENQTITADKVIAKGQILEEERHLSTAKCGVWVKEAQAYENQISSLRDPARLEERIAHYERQLADLELQRSKNLESSTTQLREIYYEIEQAFSAMDQLENFFASQVQETKMYHLSCKAFCDKDFRGRD